MSSPRQRRPRAGARRASRWRDLLRGRRELPAGVVDEDVDRPEALESGVDERVDLIGLADVGRHGEARVPAASISACTASRGSSGRRPQITTDAPVRASSQRGRAPIPVPPPVTSATLPAFASGARTGGRPGRSGDSVTPGVCTDRRPGVDAGDAKAVVVRASAYGDFVPTRPR